MILEIILPGGSELLSSCRGIYHLIVILPCSEFNFERRQPYHEAVLRMFCIHLVKGFPNLFFFFFFKSENSKSACTWHRFNSYSPQLQVFFISKSIWHTEWNNTKKKLLSILFCDDLAADYVSRPYRERNIDGQS